MRLVIHYECIHLKSKGVFLLGYIACLCLKIPICSGNATYQFQTIKSINRAMQLILKGVLLEYGI